MNINSKLVGCSLIAAIILSLFPYPSLGIHGQQAPAKGQQEPVLVGQLVQNRTPDQELSKHLRKYDLIRMDPSSAAAQVRKSGRLLLKSSVRDFELKMAPYDLRSADYVAQVIDSHGVAHPLPKTEVHTYRGDVKGSPDAQARMSLTDRGIEGAIITKQGRYFLQPARSISKEARADEFVLYESSDLEKHDGTCGVTVADEVAAQEDLAKAAAATDIIEAEASGPVSSLSLIKVARIATDADGEYVSSLGGPSQANAHIASILNFVDGIYQSEIGVSFQIVQQNTWSNANTDPYTSTVPSTRLSEFRNRWNAPDFASGGSTAPVRSLAHLFTGVDLDGTTVGIASLGVTCRNPNFAYGLSQQLSVGIINARTVVLTAHEIGHNFSATHTNQIDTLLQTPADVEPACEETIMEASLGDGSSFCPFSRSQIAGWANAFSSCLTDTSTAPPTSQDCATTPLPAGGAVVGTLSAGDCRSPSRGVHHFADRYSFNGNAGQRVSITMDQTGGGLDPFLYLIGPSGYFVAQNDDGNGGVNSRIPFSVGTITLPDTGVYTIEATSFGQQQTGSYTINLNANSCTINVGPGSFHFPAGGGTGTVNVTVTGCGGDNTYQFVASPSTQTWLVPETTSASGSRSINFTVQANSSTAGRRAFLLIGRARTSDDTSVIPVFSGGLRIPITQSGTGPDCSSTPIALGQTLGGALAASDCLSPVRGLDTDGNGRLADRYTFNAAAGQKVIIQTSAQVGNPDTFLALLGPNGVVLITDDDSGGGTTNSRIPGGNGSLTLGLTGTYTIEVSGFDTSDTGPYSLTLTSTNTVGPLQILLEESGPTADQAAAFDSILWLRDPFSVINSGNLMNPPSDPNTRVVIFVANLSPSSAVLVNLLDNNNQSHDITPQDVRAVPDVDFTQVTFRLPSNLAVGPCSVKVISNGVTSNTARIRIKS